jgi:hypothetical protein
MSDWISTPESSHVAAIKYNPETRELFIRFNDDSEYQYSGVPEKIWEELLASGSKGRFVNVVIKRSGFQYSRIS